MRLEASTLFGRRLHDGPSAFGTQHFFTVILLLVTLPVFLIGAVVALPLGAVVLAAELARSAWIASRKL